MSLGKRLTGSADFSFEYFINGGNICYDCNTCSSKVYFHIEIYKTGELVEQVTNDLDDTILYELISKNIVAIRNNKNKWNLGLSKYILRNMDALYSIIRCDTCNAKYMAIFGMGEIQPSREEVQFKGIWELKMI